MHELTHKSPHSHTYLLVITPISQLSEAERVYGSFMGGEAALGSPFGCQYKWLLWVCVYVCGTPSDCLAHQWALVRTKYFSHSSAQLSVHPCVCVSVTHRCVSITAHCEGRLLLVLSGNWVDGVNAQSVAAPFKVQHIKRVRARQGREVEAGVLDG